MQHILYFKVNVHMDRVVSPLLYGHSTIMQPISSLFLAQIENAIAKEPKIQPTQAN